MKEKSKVYTVEREFLAKCTVSEFVSKIVASHLKCGIDRTRKKRLGGTEKELYRDIV